MTENCILFLWTGMALALNRARNIQVTISFCNKVMDTFSAHQIQPTFLLAFNFFLSIKVHFLSSLLLSTLKASKFKAH